MIRSAWLALNLIVGTIPLALFLLIGSRLGASERTLAAVPTIWSRWVLWASGVTVHAEGLEHLVPGRAQIIVSNHSSWFDVAALCAIIPKRYRFVAKKELSEVPLWGPAWLKAGHIAIDRENTQSAVGTLDKAARIVAADGSAIVIFPEGTRSATGELQTFKKGAFMLALHTGIELVPAGIRGSRDVLARDSWRVRSGRIIVRFGPPVPVTEYTSKTREKLVTRVRADITRLMSEPAQES